MQTYICRTLNLLWFAFGITSLPGQQINWESRPFETNSGIRVEDASWGMLSVPEDHAQPGGRRLKLALLRLPSTSEVPGYPIVYLAGGPGGSGIELAQGGRWPLFQALRAFGDVITYDQRGAGISRPSLDSEDRLSYPLDQPLDRAGFSSHLAEVAGRVAGTFREQGFDLSQYNTSASADDLELLRQGLGVRKIRAVAMSYGTHLGLEMMRRHPDAIERIVLAGVEGPDHSLKLPSQFDAAIDAVGQLLVRDPKTARYGRDLRGQIQDLIREFEAEPVRVPFPGEGTGTITLGADDLRLFFAAILSRRDSIIHFPRLLGEMQAGEFGLLANMSAGLRRQPIQLMGLLMDTASFGSPARIRQIEEERAISILGDALEFPLYSLRAALPEARLPEDYWEPVRSNIPTLFLSGDLDARTPVANAYEVLRGIPRHEHVIVEGAGHDSSLLVGSPEIVGLIGEFFNGASPSQTRVSLPPIEFALPAPELSQESDRLLIAHANVLTSDGRGWREDYGVLIDKGHILRIAPTGAFSAADREGALDAKGRYLTPGLWDVHVHVSKLRRSSLPQFLYHGVIGVRDLGGELAELRRWQRQIERGELRGPRILTVGSFLEAEGNVQRMLRDDVVEPVERSRIGVRDPQHAREVVAELAQQSVHGIKIRTTTDRPTYFAIAEAAAAHGLPLYGHAENLSPEDLLRAGQRSLEHGFLPPLANRSVAEAQALAKALAETGMVMVPTLAAWQHSILVSGRGHACRRRRSGPWPARDAALRLRVHPRRLARTVSGALAGRRAPVPRTPPPSPA